MGGISKFEHTIACAFLVGRILSLAVAFCLQIITFYGIGDKSIAFFGMEQSILVQSDPTQVFLILGSFLALLWWWLHPAS